MASARDTSKIQKELAIVQRDIKSTLEKFKSAEGPQKQRFVDMLKKLQEKRKKLDAELEASINDLYADAELDVVDEMINIKTFRLSKLIERIVNKRLNENRSSKIDALRASNRIIDNKIRK